MNVLAIMGSYGRGGTIRQVVDEIMTGVKEAGHSPRIIRLPELSLSDCTHCLACREKGQCVIRDHISQVEDAISWSDVIVWATPVFWSNISAEMSRVMERLSGFLVVRRDRGLMVSRQVRGKKAVLVIACAAPWPLHWVLRDHGRAVRRMKSACRENGQKVLKTFVVTRTIKNGTIPHRSLRRARTFGRSLRDRES